MWLFYRKLPPPRRCGVLALDNSACSARSRGFSTKNFKIPYQKFARQQRMSLGEVPVKNKYIILAFVLCWNTTFDIPFFSLIKHATQKAFKILCQQIQNKYIFLRMAMTVSLFYFSFLDEFFFVFTVCCISWKKFHKISWQFTLM